MALYQRHVCLLLVALAVKQQGDICADQEAHEQNCQDGERQCNRSVL
jgi:hypothetical protein